MKNLRYKRHAYSSSPRRGGYWEWDKIQHRPDRVEARLEEALAILAYLREQDAARRRRPSCWPSGGAVSWKALTHIGEGGENPHQAVLKAVEERRKWFDYNRGVDAYRLDELIAELKEEHRRGGPTPEEWLRLEWRLAGLLAAKEEIGRILAIRPDIPRGRLTDLAQAHLHDGLYQITRYLYRPSDFVAPTGGIRSWSDPSRVLIEEGMLLLSPERRIIARSQAKRRQRAATYELAGYVSSRTKLKNKNTAALDSLARVLDQVRANKGDNSTDSFIEHLRERLDIELPGAIYLAYFGDREGNKRPPDKERRAAEETDDLERAGKAYDEQLRKLGYRGWDRERRRWHVVPEGAPLPKRLKSTAEQLAQNARDWVEYDTRGIRRNFEALLTVDDYRTGKVRKLNRRTSIQRKNSNDKPRLPLWFNLPTDPHIHALMEKEEEFVYGLPEYILPKERSGGQDSQGGWTIATRQAFWAGVGGRPTKEDPWEDSAEAEALACMEMAESYYSPRSYRDAEEKPSLDRNLRTEALFQEEQTGSKQPDVEAVPDEEELDKFDPNWRTVRCWSTPRRISRIPQWEAIQNLRRFRAEHGPKSELGLKDVRNKYRPLLDLRYGETVNGAQNFSLPERMVWVASGKNQLARWDLGTQEDVSILNALDAEMQMKGPSAFGLSPQQREIFGRFYGTGRETDEYGVEGQTLKDIAEDLGVTEGSVHKQLGRIKKRFAEKGIELPDMHRGRRRVS